MAPKHILIPKSPHWQISISPWCPKGGTATKLKYLLQFIKMYSFYWGTYIASTIQKQYFWRVYSKTQKCYPCYSLQWSFLSVPCKTRKLCEGGGNLSHNLSQFSKSINFVRGSPPYHPIFRSRACSDNYYYTTATERIKTRSLPYISLTLLSDKRLAKWKMDML